MACCQGQEQTEAYYLFSEEGLSAFTWCLFFSLIAILMFALFLSFFSTSIQLLLLMLFSLCIACSDFLQFSTSIQLVLSMLF